MLQFIDSSRFIASSLSSLVNNLSKGNHKIKYKYENDDKNVKLKLITKTATTFLNVQTLEMI